MEPIGTTADGPRAEKSEYGDSPAIHISEGVTNASVEMLERISKDDPELVYKTFQEVLTALQGEIAQLSKMEEGGPRKATNDELLTKISGLSNWVVDIGPKLSTRDQEGYSNHIRSLQADLRSASNPKKSRFKFKSRLPNPSSPSSSSPGSSPAIIAMPPKNDSRHLHFSLPNAVDSDSDVLPSGRPLAPTSVSRAAVAPDSHSVIADEIGKSLDLPSTAGRPVTLNGLHDCVVRNTSDAKIPALYLRKMRGCVIDGGWVSGSVFVEDVAESVIFVRGRQVRVHETKKTALVIDVRSQPVVEGCQDVTFAQLDRGWMESRYGADPGENQWDKVLDFKWHKDGPSPNWKALGKEGDGQQVERLGGEELERFLRTDWSRMDILKAAGVDVRRGNIALPAPMIVVDEA